MRKDSHRHTPSNTPINTGKVLIGAAYQPSRSWMAEDQIWLQNMLIKRKQDIEPIGMQVSDFALLFTYIIAIVVFVLTF